MTNEIKIKNFLDHLRTYLTGEELKHVSKIFRERSQKDSNSKKTIKEIKLSLISFRLILDDTLIYLKKTSDDEKYSEILLSLMKFFITNGYYSLAFNLSNSLLLRAKKKKELSNYYGYGLLNIAEIYSRQALWENAIKTLDSAKKLFLLSHDSEGLARCECLFGTVRTEQGNLKKAETHFLEGLNNVENSNQLVAGLIHNNLGILNIMRSNFEQALSYFKRALIVFESHNRKNYVANVSLNIGMIYVKQEKVKDALKEIDKCINLASLIDFKGLLAMSYLSKSYLFSMTNDLQVADVWLEKSMALAVEINDNLTIADCYKVKGIILRKMKNYKDSESYLLKSLQLNKEYDSELNYAESCTEIGILYKEKNNPAAAKEYLSKALAYYKKINSSFDCEKIKAYL